MCKLKAWGLAVGLACMYLANHSASPKGNQLFSVHLISVSATLSRSDRARATSLLSASPSAFILSLTPSNSCELAMLASFMVLHIVVSSLSFDTAEVLSTSADFGPHQLGGLGYLCSSCVLFGFRQSDMSSGVGPSKAQGRQRKKNLRDGWLSSWPWPFAASRHVTWGQGFSTGATTCTWMTIDVCRAHLQKRRDNSRDFLRHECSDSVCQ